MHNKQLFWEFLILTFLVSLNEVLASTKCGLVPNQVFLKRGERKQLIFWTDQDYDATSAKPGATNQGEPVDLLLQLVNGAMPKPEQIFNLQEEEETYPQFQGVSSTTTTTTTTITQTTTPTATTTTVLSIKDTTSNIIIEDESEVENVVTSTISSTNDKEDLVGESTSELPSLPNDSVETTLSSLFSDIEESDNEADNAPSITEVINSSETVLQTGTTLPTVSEETDIDTVTPLIISQNAEEIIEIVEPFPSQQMEDGPTPSIIIAEIVKPEETNIETDETTSAQNDLENDTTTPQTEISSNEQLQQVNDLPDYTLLETSSEVEEATSTIKASTTVILDISVPTTVYPLLVDSFEEIDDSKADIENTLAEEITEPKPTISNVDGFHITISNPIKSESKTEAPIYVEEIQDTEIFENSISNDTNEVSGIDVLEEEENSPTTIQSTTDKIIDDTTIIPVVSQKTTTENLDNIATEANSATDEITTVAPVMESVDESLPISIEVSDQSTTPPEITSFEQGTNNSLPSATDIKEMIQSEQIADDDSDDADNLASLVTTTENSEEIQTDEIIPVEETSIKNTDTVISITEIPTTTEIIDNEILNEEDNLDTILEVPVSTISNIEDIEQVDIISTMPSTIIEENEQTTTIEQEHSTSGTETTTATSQTTTNEKFLDSGSVNGSPVNEVVAIDEVLFDDPDDEPIPQEDTSTIVPFTTIQENSENENEMKDNETESAIKITTTNPSFQSKTESIITTTTTEEASTIRISPVDVIEVEEAETNPLIFTSTNTETNNILLEEFKPSTNALKNQESDVVQSSSTTVDITTIPTTTVLVELSEFSSELEVSETEPNETIELTTTRTNLIDIISPSKHNEKETYEFQDELEAINELNKTIHDIESSLTSNETDTNAEHDLKENVPTLHNDALSHKNPLDTQDLENKVELIEIPYSNVNNDEQIGEVIVNEIYKKSYESYLKAVEQKSVENITLASTDIDNTSTDILMETQQHNVSTSTSSPTDTTTNSVTETTSTIPTNDEAMQNDDTNEDGLNAKDTTTIINFGDEVDRIDVVNDSKIGDEVDRVDVVNNYSNNHLEDTTDNDVTTEQFSTYPSTKTTTTTGSSSHIVDREHIEFGQTVQIIDTTSSFMPLLKNDTNEPSNNNSRNAVFDETTTGSPLESSTTILPLRIEAVVAEFEEEVQTTTEQEIFNETTTEAPLKHVSNAAPLPIFIPHEIEEEEEKIFETEAVISDEKPVFILEEQKQFIYTTTLPPSTTEAESTTGYEDENIGEIKFDIEAVVAEEENDNKNEDGTFIETTTVLLRKLAASKIDVADLSGKEDTPYSQIVDIRQSTNVNGPLDLETIADKPDADSSVPTEQKVLQKLTRKEDTDVEVDNDIVDLQKLSDEESADNVPAIEEKVDDKNPGSLLTSFIDGFFVPKQKNKPKKKNPNRAFASIKVISEKESDDEPNDDAEKEDTAVPEKEVPFPMSDILNGIYKLVSNFVTSKPKISSEDSEPTTTTSFPINFRPAQLGPINVHNMPRDQLIVEFLDEDNSPSDPFFQLQAPNLRDENVDSNIPAFPVKPNPPKAITLSPFNSPALTVQDPPKISDGIVAGPLPLNAPIERLYPEGFVGDVSRPSTVEDSAPPLPFLPGNFLRGGQPSKPIPFSSRPSPTYNNLREEPSQSALLALRNSNQRTRDPINIPLLPDLINESQEDESQSDTVFRRFSDIQEVDPVQSLRNSDSNFVSFLRKQTSSFKDAFFGPITYENTETSRSKRQLDIENENITLLDNELDESEDQAIVEGEENQVNSEEEEESQPSSPEDDDEAINCNWNIKTESDLYLLVTFHNLSAPFTVDCEGAYIEVERENNGFEARWCGNRVTQGGSRPHVIFAKNEVRISIFDDGSQGKELPTGFSAEVEVIDLFDGQQYSNLRRSNAYSNVRKLTG